MVIPPLFKVKQLPSANVGSALTAKIEIAHSIIKNIFIELVDTLHETIQNVNSILNPSLTLQLKTYYYKYMRIKKFHSIFISLILLLSFAQTAFAQSQPLCPPGAYSSLCDINANSAGGVAGTIIQLLLIVAILASLFFMIYGGIRYISSGGDKGKVDQARGTIVAAIIGLVISLLGFFVVNLVLMFFTGHGVSTLTIPKLYNP